MEDTPVLKWTLAALGVIVACFCLGYFVMGPSPRTSSPPSSSSIQVTEAPDGNGVNAPSTRVRPSSKPALIVEDQTSEYEAKLKKLEEEKQKAEEARKKAEEALRQKELESAQPSPMPSEAPTEASPSPETTPTPEAGTDAAGDNNTTTTAPPPADTHPTPEVHAPTPKPATPKPPTPKPATPEPKPASSGMYKVQLGGYGSREAANTVAAELRGRGFSTLIVSEESGGKSTFRVQVGAFKSKATAESTAKELQANGYDAAIHE